MKSETNLKRRNFLLAASLAGAGAAAALLVEGRVMPQAAATKQPTPPAGRGYQQTEHVRRYYSTARM